MSKKLVVAIGLAALGGYMFWTRRVKVQNLMIAAGLLKRYIPSDQEAHYDIDGVSLCGEGVVVASSQ